MYNMIIFLFLLNYAVSVNLSKIHWKLGKAAGSVKMDDPPFIKAWEQAEVSLEPRTL